MKQSSISTVSLVLSLSLVIFNLAGAKEEPLLDDVNSISNLDNQIFDDLGPISSPEELLPIWQQCSNLAAMYDKMQKRTFNAWGGKRSSPLYKAFLRGEYEKKNFNPWGGKRQSNLIRQTKNDIGDNRKPVFNPWGGR